jgi:dolichol kinase
MHHLTIGIVLLIFVGVLAWHWYPKQMMWFSVIFLAIWLVPMIPTFRTNAADVQALVSKCSNDFFVDTTRDDCLKAQRAVAEYNGKPCDRACKIMIATNGRPFGEPDTP